jgi:hypothetical protein
VKLMNQVANSRRDGEDSGNMVKKNILLGEPASPSQGTEFWHCYISLDRYPSLPNAKCKIFTGKGVFRVVLRLVMCFIFPAHLSFPIFLVSPHPSSYFQLLFCRNTLRVTHVICILHHSITFTITILNEIAKMQKLLKTTILDAVYLA